MVISRAARTSNTCETMAEVLRKGKLGWLGQLTVLQVGLRKIQSCSELLQTRILLDDVVIFPYNIPHQAMLVVELKKLADLLERINVRPDLVKQAREWADTVDKAIWKYGVVSTEEWGKVFAYEVDGSLSSFTLSYCHSYTVLCRIWGSSYARR